MRAGVTKNPAVMAGLAVFGKASRATRELGRRSFTEGGKPGHDEMKETRASSAAL
jgi:hypothetical protein